SVIHRKAVLPIDTDFAAGEPVRSVQREEFDCCAPIGRNLYFFGLEYFVVGYQRNLPRGIGGIETGDCSQRADLLRVEYPPWRVHALNRPVGDGCGSYGVN